MVATDSGGVRTPRIWELPIAKEATQMISGEPTFGRSFLESEDLRLCFPDCLLKLNCMEPEEASRPLICITSFERVGLGLPARRQVSQTVHS